MVFKYVKIGGIVVIILLLLLVLKAIFTGGRSPSAPGTSSVTPRGPTITLIAIRAVQVKVARPSPEDNEKDGEVLFSGPMAAGETKVIARPGEIFVEAEPRANLDMDINGRRINLGQMLTPYDIPNGPKNNRGRLQAP